MDDFDIFTDLDSTKKSEAGVRMEIIHAGTKRVITCQTEEDSEPRELYLVLLGIDSPETRRVFMQLQNRESNRAETTTISNDDWNAEVKSASKALARLTVGGLIFGKTDGSEKSGWIEVNKDNAYSLYVKSLTIRNQAMAHVLDVGKYLG